MQGKQVFYLAGKCHLQFVEMLGTLGQHDDAAASAIGQQYVFYNSLTALNAVGKQFEHILNTHVRLAAQRCCQKSGNHRDTDTPRWTASDYLYAVRPHPP